MQLDSQRSIRTAVTAITATLLGSSVARAEGTKTDSSILIYNETGRVTAAEGVFDFARKFSERRTAGLRLTLDALTGASPNGATPSTRAQTFTGPSGGASYTAAPGEIPLDDTFTDKRIALDGRLNESLSRITFLNVGGHLSYEHDYTSLGANGSLTHDLNRRNTTLGISAAYSLDMVRPIGGAPVPFSSMPPPTQNEGGGEGEDEGEGGGAGPAEMKHVMDAGVGLTQVIDRQTLIRMDYSVHRTSGYLHDPYKILSVVQDRNAAEPGEPADYVYEKRPDTRFKQTIYGQLKRYIAGSAVDVGYRYFWDDWGIKSHTADFFFWLPLKAGHAIEPHFRWYRQTAADFHYYYLVQGQTLPNYASADARLAEFDAYTYGLQYTFPLNTGFLNVTGEYYTQNGKRGPPNPIGILNNYDLFPPMEVYMVRVGYTHEF